MAEDAGKDKPGAKSGVKGDAGGQKEAKDKKEQVDADRGGEKDGGDAEGGSAAGGGLSIESAMPAQRPRLEGTAATVTYTDQN